MFLFLYEYKWWQLGFGYTCDRPLVAGQGEPTYHVPGFMVGNMEVLPCTFDNVWDTYRCLRETVKRHYFHNFLWWLRLQQLWNGVVPTFGEES